VDVTDNFSTFAGQGKKRDTFYKKSKYAVKSYAWTAGTSMSVLNVSSKDILTAAEAVPQDEKKETKQMFHYLRDEDDDDE
jgi:hypothetical protein